MGVETENEETVSLSPSSESLELQTIPAKADPCASVGSEDFADAKPKSPPNSSLLQSELENSDVDIPPVQVLPMKETNLQITDTPLATVNNQDEILDSDDDTPNANENSSLLNLPLADDKQNLGEVPVVISVDAVDEAPSRPISPREAAVAFGKPKHSERSAENSPFSYKNWILQLTIRRRLEIFIAVGLSVWIAFFIVLAIFMNGQAVPPADGDGTSGSSSTGNVIPLQPQNKYKNPQPVTPTNSNKSLGNATVLNATSRHGVVTPTISSTTSGSSWPESDQTGSDNLFTTAANSFHTASTTNVKQQTSEDTTKQAQESRSASTLNEWIDELLTNRMVYPKPDSLKKLSQVLEGQDPNYLIGVGRADITGPAADANMMGYANPNQVAGGIHFRQYARAFIFGEVNKKRVVFVNIDACMGSTLVKLEVLKKLKLIYGELYSADNLCISGTHTHSAPAGFLQYVLFQITSMGYIPETLDVMVEGIVKSIRIAHETLEPGYILINKGQLLDSNINRSPSAYLYNPIEERKRYPYDVDKDMTLIKLVNKNGKGLGMINWFAVHCTSMNNTNSLISGDNKGYAQLLFEEQMDPGSLPGESKFVAAFAQSNEGDVSPNTRGPHCIDTGDPCDNVHSTCNGKVQNCIASGPGKDMFESTKIIAQNQFRKALELYKNSQILLKGPLQVVHQNIDMSNQSVPLNSSHWGRTCTPAMGFSFAAGTTDGPGAFDFKQGDRTGNTFWKFVRNFLRSPSQDQKDCHAPKPILLDTGEMKFPYDWQPEIVDTQLIRIGQLLISALPGEFTTMSGRRIKDAVLRTFAENFPDERFEPVIAGLSNTYSDYVATFEEYQLQRYEGASTIYGPHTLQAFVQQYKKLANAAAKGLSLHDEKEAHDLKASLQALLPGVVYDSPGLKSMGDVIVQVNETYKVGDTVSVEFVAGNPRNSQSNNMTFLTVERQTKDGGWQVVQTDGSWDTKYIWKRTSTVRALSEVVVQWHISKGTPSGHYRIQHHGHYKWFLTRNIYPYTGTSKVFRVLESDT